MTEPTRKPGRLGVGIIGAGKVGAVLGSALRAAGHAVVGISAVSDASLERAENLLPGVPVLDVPDVVERSELVLVAVPDDALEQLVSGLAATRTWQAGQIVAHTSGRFGTGVLAPASAMGVIGLALHPAMTFTGMSLDLSRLPDCTFAVTAPAAVLPIAQALVVEMGAEPIVLEEADRIIYHTALAHASNHLVTITAQSAELLRSIGVEDPSRLLGPLLRASLENALASGETALTGPVARGDLGTVRAHTDALESVQSEDIRHAYRELAKATAARAAGRGTLKPDQASAILDILSGGNSGSS